MKLGYTDYENAAFQEEYYEKMADIIEKTNESRIKYMKLTGQWKNK